MQTGRIVLVLAFLVTFLAVGIPYWLIPYSKVSLPGSLIYAMAIACGVAAAVRVVAATSFLQAFVAVGLAIPAAVMARVQFDTFRDPTSHNLWPFEIVFAAGIGFPASLIGAWLGGLLAAAWRRSSAQNHGA